MVLESKADSKSSALTQLRRSTPVDRTEQSQSSNGSLDSIIECVDCGRANQNARRFCSQCGASLWHACPSCAIECPVNEAFCGSCGTNVGESRQQKAAEIDSLLARVDELRTSHQHVLALALVKNSHSTSQTLGMAHHQRITDLITKLEREVAHWRQESANALGLAESLVTRHQYGEAVEALKRIPSPYLCERGNQLLRIAVDAAAEIQTLRSEILADVEARRIPQLAPKIDRYLALQSSDEHVQQLASRVAELIHRKAKEAVVHGQFRKAKDLLRSMPLTGRTTEIQQLIEYVAETNRIMHELENAPIVDSSLLQIGQRLQKMSPQKEDIVRTLELMKKRSESAPADRRFPLAAWAPVPRRTSVGVPIEILAGFQRLQPANASISGTLRKLPTGFFVACGLALQGLDESQLTPNLLGERKGLLGKVAFFKTKRAANSAWGIDLGGSSLKAIKLARDASAHQWVISDADLIPFRMNLDHPDAQRQRSEIVREALQTFKQRHEVSKDDTVCTNSTSAKTLVRILPIPDAPDSKLSEVIQYEAARNIPIPLAELSWSYSRIATTQTNSSEEAASYQAVLVASRSQFVRDRIEDFASVGFEIDVVQADCVALHNYLMFDAFESASETSKPMPATNSKIALLEVGSDSCNLVVSSHTSFWVRTFRLGGNDISQSLVRDLKVTFEQAEDLKRNFGKVRRISTALEAIEPVLVKIGNELQRSLESLPKEFPIQGVWLCGGASLQYGLLRYLRSGSPDI